MTGIGCYPGRCRIEGSALYGQLLFAAPSEKDVIQTPAPNTPKEALRYRIGPRCLDWGAHDSDSSAFGDPGGGGSELGIVVPDQELWFLIVGRGVPDASGLSAGSLEVG